MSYFDAETNKRLKFLTNNFTLPALTIAQIYSLDQYETDADSQFTLPLDFAERYVPAVITGFRPNML